MKEHIESIDREFMTTVYHKYCRLMFYVAVKYCAEEDVRQEIVQDCLVKLIEKADKLKTLTEDATAGYIAATVKNAAISRGKKDSRIKQRVSSLEEIEDAAFAVSGREVEAYYDIHEGVLNLRRIWSKLSFEEQNLLEGKYILGYNDNELSKQLGTKPSSVRMKLTRARRHALKLIMEVEYEQA